MPDDVLTFEELRRVQSKERDSDTLTELEEGFFERARNYLELKKEPENPLQGQEYRNARNILQDILDMRQKKIVKLAFLSVKSNVTVDNLLDAEEEMFAELEETVGSYRHDMQEQVFEGRLTVSGSASAGGDMEAGGQGSEDAAAEPDTVTSEASDEDAADAGTAEEPGEEPVTTGETTDSDGADEEADLAAGAGADDGPVEPGTVTSAESGNEQEDAEDDEPVIVDGAEEPGDDEDEADRDEGPAAHGTAEGVEDTGDVEEDDGDDRVIFGGDTGEDAGGDEGGSDAEEDDEIRDDGNAGEADEDDGAGKAEPEPEEDDGGEDGTRVRALQDVNEFMGTDLEAYGPIDEGEEAVVPEKNAEILVDQGKAERVD